VPFKSAGSQSSQVQVKSKESVTTQLHEESAVARDKFVPVSRQENEEASQDYRLERDKEMRTIKPPKRYGHADLISCTLIVGKRLKIMRNRSPMIRP